MRLITVLGNNGAGRRAILQAVAKQQGITDEDDLEELVILREVECQTQGAEIHPSGNDRCRS